MLYGSGLDINELSDIDVLILIFLENALRQLKSDTYILGCFSLNPYFFGKCSTAKNSIKFKKLRNMSLNPYFFGKCSTAAIIALQKADCYRS